MHPTDQFRSIPFVLQLLYKLAHIVIEVLAIFSMIYLVNTRTGFRVQFEPRQFEITVIEQAVETTEAVIGI